MTVLDMIKSSLRLLQVLAPGGVPSNDEAKDAREALNQMLGVWNNDSRLTMRQHQEFVVASGTQSYVIGSGQTWDGNKPLRIKAVTLRGSDNVRYPIKQINEIDYLRIYDLTAEGPPTQFYYKPGTSTGTFYFNRTPAQAYTAIISSRNAFSTYTTIGETILVPSGYEKLIRYGLAIELMSEYPIPGSAGLIKSIFNETMVLIKSNNSERASPLRFDPILTGTTGRGYDINTDTFL
jgi:hypothetical protein